MRGRGQTEICPSFGVIQLTAFEGMERDGELSGFSKDLRPRLARVASKEARDGGFSFER